MLEIPEASRGHQHMPATAGEHAFDVSDQVHAVLTYIVQPADEWRDVNRSLRTPGCRKNRGCLCLREAKGDVGPQAFGGGMRGCLEPFSRAWILDVLIRNPRIHLPAL